MNKISFRGLITFCLIIANIIFFSMLYLLFQNFFLENTKKKFIDENMYSLKVAEDFFANELKDLEKISKEIANNDRVRYALIKNKQVQVQVDVLSDTDTNYKITDINLFGYKRLATGMKAMYLDDRGASEDISRRDVEFYNQTFQRIADTAVKKNAPLKQSILDEFSKAGKLGTTISISNIDYLNDNFIIRGSSDVGSNHEKTYFGVVSVKEVLDGITLDKIKKISNKDLVIIKDNKIILSTLYNGTERVVDKNIDSSFSSTKTAFPININNKELLFNFAPINDFNNKTIGYIGVGFYSGDMMTIFQNSSKNIILYFVIFTIILIVIISAILGILFKPFNKVITGIKKFSTGDYSDKIKTKAIGELNTLVINVNALAESVHKREVELKEKNEELLEMDKLKDQFLANTSHELRTPLNGIIGLSESLIDGISGKLPKEAVFNLNMITTSGRRLLNLINDILDFSKMKNQTLTIKQAPVNIKLLTDSVILMTRPLVGTKELTVENWINSSFPNVSGDLNRLQQILFNLIGNAIKFSDNGNVRITSEVKDNKAFISISDTGIGIAPENFETIFKSFEQIEDSDTRQYGGTGLGLSISKKLIEVQGGTISLKSELGKGSTFTFSIPLSNEQITIDDSHLSLPMELDKEFSMFDIVENNNTFLDAENAIKVLVVDDEIINLQVMTNHLKNENILSDIATNGYDAIKKVEKFAYDVIVLDIMMPKMSGYEVCKTLRESYTASEVPILMLTAKDRPEDIVLGFDAGANDYVVKPFEKKELIARIKTLANLKKAVKTSIVNAQNFEMEKQQKQISEKLREINNELTTTLDLRKVTEKLLIELSRVVSYDKAFALLKTDDFYEVFSYDDLLKTPDITKTKFSPNEDDIINKILKEKKPILFNNPQKSLSPKENVEINGIVGIPVTYRKETIGAIILESSKKDFYTNATLELILTIAGQAGIAIENARLFSKLTEALERIKSIQKMVSTIYTEKDKSKAINHLLSLLLTNIGINFEKVLYMDYLPEESSLLLQSKVFIHHRFEQSPNNITEDVKVSKSQNTLINKAIHNNEFILSDHSSGDILPDDVIKTSLFMKNFCLLPIVFASNIFGLIIIEPLDAADLVKTKEEMETIKLFAQNLSIYLENKRLESNYLQIK